MPSCRRTLGVLIHPWAGSTPASRAFTLLMPQRKYTKNFRPEHTDDSDEGILLPQEMQRHRQGRYICLHHEADILTFTGIALKKLFQLGQAPPREFIGPEMENVIFISTAH
ncbi:MAG: hypothetical protein QW413_06080 [Nitrososphaerota archaeon]